MTAIRRARTLEHRTGDWVGRFDAMASPCEILLDGDDANSARRALEVASEEAWRIEARYSRYRSDSIVSEINRRAGEAVEVDAETMRLLRFADEAFGLSEGRFDLTSGALRRAWTFDGSDRIPDDATVEAALAAVGWDRVRLDASRVTLAPGQEIDLGGLGKEYAVDRVAALVRRETKAPLLVNFGGDLATDGPRRSGAAWSVGVEGRGANAAPVRTLSLERGGVATSGDARRFLERDGTRYSHVLDPRTGRPVIGAPGSVTVWAETCVQAGLLATLALLHGAEAAPFLRAEGVRHWCETTGPG